MQYRVGCTETLAISVTALSDIYGVLIIGKEEEEDKGYTFPSAAK